MKKPFNLLRWFGLVSPIVIVAIAAGNAWLMSTFLTTHLFQRDAAISRDFMQNIFLADGSVDFLERPDDPAMRERFERSAIHLANLPDVLRANLYDREQRVLWSTDPSLVGKSFEDNDELDSALAGNLVVHAGSIDVVKAKSEHIGLDPSARFFIETYIPLHRSNAEPVLGAIELYKAPVPLTEAIQEARREVALAALLSALVLYMFLFGIVRRADVVIRQQHEQLRDTEAQALIQELTSAVAHNIRNPLSSIQSAAELIADFPEDEPAKKAGEIVEAVTRISDRVTEMLRLSAASSLNLERVDLCAFLLRCVSEQRSRFKARQLSLRFETPLNTAWVQVDAILLNQVLFSLLSNAAEAMGDAGDCRVRLSERDRGHFQIEVVDSGPGVPPADIDQLFKPFFTTKSKGLGLGLPLARKLMESLGGSLTIAESAGRGATIRIAIPKAAS